METILTAFMNGAIACCPLVLSVWLMLRFSRRFLNAATRYSIWWIVMAAVILAPLLYMPGRIPRAVTVAPRATGIFRQQSPRAETLLPPTVSTPAPAPVGRRVQLKLKPAVIVEVWIALSASMLLRLALSFALLRRRRSRGIPAGGDVRALARRCLDRCGVTRRVETVISVESSSPMVSGPFRPFLLLPEALVHSLDPRELELVCLHEAAHLARFDDAALLVQRLMQAALVWNPLVYWIGRQMDLEREVACDDFVVSLTSEPKAYASCLAHVAEVAGAFRMSPVAAAPMDGRSHLSTRVELLLDRTRRAGSRLLRSRLLVSTTVLAALAIVSAKSPALVAFASAQTRVVPAVVIAQAQAPKPAASRAPSPKPTPAASVEPAPAIMRVTVSVADPLHRFVTGLVEENFNVLEGGVKQRITKFTGEDQPVSMWIVWDVHENDTAELRTQLAQLEVELVALNATYSSAHPKVRTVEARIAKVKDLMAGAGGSSRADDVARLLSESDPGDRFSVLRVDAQTLAEGADQLRQSRDSRNVVVVVESGNRQSDLLLPGSEFANAVGDMRVPVFPLAVESADSIAPQLKRIVVELRNQYVLEYASRQKTPGAVQVTLNQPRGLQPLTPVSRAVLISSLLTQ